jgi:predicted ATPase
MLRDIAIQNYRSFKDFQVDGLARVNLIVGANNSGKTSLLEAIYLLVNQNDPGRLTEILENRGEMMIEHTPVNVARRTGYQISQLFHGRQVLPKTVIRIGSQQDRPLTLQISLHPPERSVQIAPQQMPLAEDTADRKTPVFEFVLEHSQEATVKIPVRDDGSLAYRIPRLLSREIHQPQFLTTNNLDYDDLAGLWDMLQLTPEEDKVIEALQILDPAVERIGFASRPTLNTGIRLKLRNQSEPVPLGSLGDGMRRIFTLAMTEIGAENSVLLVDEIDTGLYYRAQTNMWRLLIQTAQRLNVQIFATTHSLDCVQAFQAALSEEQDEEVGKLFRLSVRGGGIRPVAYTARDLEIAVQQEIEVR